MYIYIYTLYTHIYLQVRYWRYDQVSRAKHTSWTAFLGYMICSSSGFYFCGINGPFGSMIYSLCSNMWCSIESTPWYAQIICIYIYRYICMYICTCTCILWYVRLHHVYMHDIHPHWIQFSLHRHWVSVSPWAPEVKSHLGDLEISIGLRPPRHHPNSWWKTVKRGGHLIFHGF